MIGTKLIPLTQGKFAIVDEEDYVAMSKFKWAAQKSAHETFYAKSGKKILLMHRLIINAPAGIQVDHLNHDGLDNRKINLRLCSNAQNARNARKKLTPCSSKFKGVSWDKLDRKWKASIRFNRKSRTIGRFNTEDQAAIAYNEKAKELFGEFACLNKI